MNNKVLSLIPQTEPFRFVDAFIQVSSEKVIGTYTFKEEAFFYKGHFPGNPITPGVILTETMTQIGLLGLGICMSLEDESLKDFSNVVLTSSDVSFLKPVYPGEQVFVEAVKVYFRLGKLKCRVRLTKADETLVCKGELSGMIISKN